MAQGLGVQPGRARHPCVCRSPWADLRGSAPPPQLWGGHQMAQGQQGRPPAPLPLSSTVHRETTSLTVTGGAQGLRPSYKSSFRGSRRTVLLTSLRSRRSLQQRPSVHRLVISSAEALTETGQVPRRRQGAASSRPPKAVGRQRFPGAPACSADIRVGKPTPPSQSPPYTHPIGSASLENPPPCKGHLAPFTPYRWRVSHNIFF